MIRLLSIVMLGLLTAAAYGQNLTFTAPNQPAAAAAHKQALIQPQSPQEYKNNVGPQNPQHNSPPPANYSTESNTAAPVSASPSSVPDNTTAPSEQDQDAEQTTANNNNAPATLPNLPKPAAAPKSQPQQQNQVYTGFQAPPSSGTGSTQQPKSGWNIQY